MMFCRILIEDQISITQEITFQDQRSDSVLVLAWCDVRKEYDFSKFVENPRARFLEKQITLRLGVDVIDCFKKLADETGVPYQILINPYLQDYAHSAIN
jgi:predicted DNA binding CopG/RHH family protein